MNLHRKILLSVVIFLLSIICSKRAVAQPALNVDTKLWCRDINGVFVTAILNSSLNNVAVATTVYGVPVIRDNPIVMGWFKPET